MSEFIVVTDARRPRHARVELEPRSSALEASASASASVSACADSAELSMSGVSSPSLLHQRGVSVAHEVTDRELFATAVGVIPKLETLLSRRGGSRVSGRQHRSNSSSSASGSRRMHARKPVNNLHWVVKKKRHGVEIREFDRSTLSHSDAVAASGGRGSFVTESTNTPRATSAASTPRTLRTPRWLKRAATATADQFSSRNTTRSSFTSDFAPQPQQRMWPHCDERVAFAATAHAELGCRLSEALELLFSTDALQFDATMSSLFGHSKYKRGDLLVAHYLPNGLNVTPTDLDELVGGNAQRGASSYYSRSGGASRSVSAFDWLERDGSLVEPSQPGWVALQSVTLRPRLNMALPAAALRKHKLNFAAYSQVHPARDEAVYVMQTLPKELQTRVNATAEFADMTPGDIRDVGGDAGSADLEQISVGYHLAASFSDLNGHQTRITMCAYVTSPEQGSSLLDESVFDDETMYSSGHSLSILNRHHRRHGQRQRPAGCSTSAKYVVTLLATATNELDRLLRRRRLGSQAFILTPLDKSVFEEHECHVCARRFGLLRAELFCQLCGHLVCRDCSRKFEVEPVARRVRRNRVCFACVAHVDANGVARVENEDQQEIWTPTRHRGRRDRRRAGRRGNGVDDEVPGFYSTRGGRSETASSSIWDAIKTHDGGVSVQEDDERDLGPPRMRRAVSMDYFEASSGQINDVDDIIDSVDDYPNTGPSYHVQTRHRAPSCEVTEVTAITNDLDATSIDPPPTAGQELADALHSGNPLSRARALEVVRRVVYHVTQPEAAGHEQSNTTSAAAAGGSLPSSSTADDSTMLRKYLEARRRLSNIANFKAGTEGVKSSGSGATASLSPKSPTKITAIKEIAEDDCFGANSSYQQPAKHKKIDLLSRPWDFRLTSSRLAARHEIQISSATDDTDDDEDEDSSFSTPAAVLPSASLDGLCEVAAARLKCPMAYVILLPGFSSETATVLGAFEVSSVRHAMPNRRLALCSAAPSILADAHEPIVVQCPLAESRFRQLGEEAGMKFFAGFPIQGEFSTSESLGANCAPLAWLCAGDSSPRDCVTLDDFAAMQTLAKLVGYLLAEQQLFTTA